MVDDPHAPADPTASSSYSFSSSPPPFPTVPIAPSVPSVPVAPTHRLVKQPFNSIEFPGPISSSSPLSLQTALRTLGSQETIDSVFNRATKVLELRFRPDDEWSHPIIGESGGAQKLVLKITTRRRRNKRAIGNGAGGPRKNMNENNGKVTADNIDPGLFEQLQGPSNEDGDDGSTNTNVADADAEEEANGSALRAKEAAKESERQVAAGKGREQQGGVFKAEIVGALRQTVRFRGESVWMWLLRLFCFSFVMCSYLCHEVTSCIRLSTQRIWAIYRSCFYVCFCFLLVSCLVYRNVFLLQRGHEYVVGSKA